MPPFCATSFIAISSGSPGTKTGLEGSAGGNCRKWSIKSWKKIGNYYFVHKVGEQKVREIAMSQIEYRKLSLKWFDEFFHSSNPGKKGDYFVQSWRAKVREIAMSQIEYTGNYH